MGGVCERPGCSRGAAAAVALDPRSRLVWVGDLEGSGASVNKLCTICADTLTAPRGWERRDVREAPRLFALPTGPDDDEPRPRKRRSRRPKADTSAAADLPIAVGQHEAAPAPPSAPATPAPTVAPDDTPPLSLGELHRGDAPVSPGAAALLAPGASTPLLARAFRSARAG